MRFRELRCWKMEQTMKTIWGFLKMGVPKTMGLSTKIFQNDLILDDLVGTPILGPLCMGMGQQLRTYPEIGWSTLKTAKKSLVMLV
jgi:hypothetical protein